MNGVVSVDLRLHEGSKYKWTVGIFNGEYNQTLNLGPKFHASQVSWQKGSAEPWIVIFDAFKPLPNVLSVMACRWVVGIVEVLINNSMEPIEISNSKI